MLVPSTPFREEVTRMKKIKVRKLDKLEATYHPYEPGNPPI